MAGPDELLLSVTDHAVVRYLERVVGADIERIREEIRKAVVAGGFDPAAETAPASIYIDVPAYGVHLVLRAGEVVTVIRTDGLED
ncbi:MAG: hypothetical protein ACK41C_10325 [Phenylobacterium sp.]|uniref:hypothetical protein n=1 Tax=Phenylobacterium sp. TaxID=1871053 RepID=UPI00391C3BC0